MVHNVDSICNVYVCMLSISFHYPTLCFLLSPSEVRKCYILCSIVVHSEAPSSLRRKEGRGLDSSWKV